MGLSERDIDFFEHDISAARLVLKNLSPRLCMNVIICEFTYIIEFHEMNNEKGKVFLWQCTTHKSIPKIYMSHEIIHLKKHEAFLLI